MAVGKKIGGFHVGMFSLVIGLVVGGVVLYHFRHKTNLMPSSQGGTNPDKHMSIAAQHDNLAYFANTRRLHWL